MFWGHTDVVLGPHGGFFGRGEVSFVRGARREEETL